MYIRQFLPRICSHRALSLLIGCGKRIRFLAHNHTMRMVSFDVAVLSGHNTTAKYRRLI